MSFSRNNRSCRFGSGLFVVVSHLEKQKEAKGAGGGGVGGAAGGGGGWRQIFYMN